MFPIIMKKETIFQVETKVMCKHVANNNQSCIFYTLAGHNNPMLSMLD